MKIPHAQGVTRALRNVRTATKKTLKGLNEVAGQRMAKGDYSAAEALAAKGRELRPFLQQSDELLRTWRGIRAGVRNPRERRMRDDAALGVLPADPQGHRDRGR